MVQARADRYWIKIQGEHGQIRMSGHPCGYLALHLRYEFNEIMAMTVVSAICGLMNGRGGMISVSIERYNYFDKMEDAPLWEVERWKSYFRKKLKQAIGRRASWRYVITEIVDADGRKVIQFKCHASRRQVYLHLRLSAFDDGVSYFPILTRSKVRLLDPRNIIRYVSVRFGNRPTIPDNCY